MKSIIETCILGVTMTWDEAKLFFKFCAGGITVFATVVALWSALDLPQAASKDYVNGKFALASDLTKTVQTSLIETRLQINKMTRQNLEGEKYTLEQKLKTSSDFEDQKRLNDVLQSLIDTQRERENLQKSVQ